MNARVLFKHLLVPTFALLIPQFRALRDRDSQSRQEISPFFLRILFFEVWMQSARSGPKPPEKSS
jgi:hypothetical protein